MRLSIHETSSVASLHGRALSIRCRRLRLAIKVRTKPLGQVFETGISHVAPHRYECDVSYAVPMTLRLWLRLDSASKAMNDSGIY